MALLRMHNYVTNTLVEVQTEELDDATARQLIPQDETAQAIFDAELREGSHVTLAMSLALCARYDLRSD